MDTDDQNINPEEVIEDSETIKLRANPKFKDWIAKTRTLTKLIEIFEKLVNRVC